MRTKLFSLPVFYSVVFLTLTSPLLAIPMMEARQKNERHQKDSSVENAIGAARKDAERDSLTAQAER